MGFLGVERWAEYGKCDCKMLMAGGEIGTRPEAVKR